MGFWVARTRNGSATLNVSRPIVTWCSCITSSSALCTLAGARLISSASSRLVKTGPSDVPNSPELQVKLHECFALKAHTHVCEGHVPVKVWLCAPDGKRLEATFNWTAFRANSYPKLKSALQKKHPGVPWP